MFRFTKLGINIAVHPFVHKILDMAVGGFYREACFGKYGFHPDIYDMPVGFRRYLHLKPEFPKKSGPEGKKIMEIKDVGNPDL